MMTIPDFQSMMLPFLRVLEDGQERSMKEMVSLLAEHYRLSEPKLSGLLPSGQQTVVSNRIAWASYFKRWVTEVASKAAIQTWQQVIQLENSRLEQLGFDWRDLAHIRTSSERLVAGEAVLRYSIRSEYIRSLVAVSMEFADGYRGADGHPLPRAIWIESSDGPLPISLAGDGSWISQVGSLVSSRGAALYGATETVAFLKLLRQNDGPSIKCLDVLDLVETVVHGPIRGLELSNVLHVAEPSAAEPNNSRDRVLGLRSVINWLAGSGGCAA